MPSAYSPLGSRSAADVNFENAVTYRQKKNDARLLNPSMPDVAVAPGWDAFNGGIDRAESDAGDKGMGFGVDFSSLGRPAAGAAGGSRMDPYGAPSTPNQLQARNDSMGAADWGTRYQGGRASLAALQANSRIMQDKAAEADWADDSVKQMQDTEDAIARQGVINNFGRGERVKDQGNLGSEYQAGAPFRNAMDYDTLSRTREMYPYGPGAAAIEAKRIETAGKVREAATNKAREDSAALHSLADMAKERARQPQQIADPTGARTGGFLGMGSRPRMVPNPAYDDLGDSMRIAQQVLSAGQEAPSGKTMSQADLQDFATENKMTTQDAMDLARQHGWTVR